MISSSSTDLSWRYNSTSFASNGRVWGKKKEDPLRLLKQGVWLYFFLILFEGALRKWFLPGLAAPLLIIRDPVALGLIFLAIKKRVWAPNLYVTWMWNFSILAFILTLLAGHQNLNVALYGLRITLFHFPLVFLIGRLFDKSDVLKIGKSLLWISIGMTLLIAVQFYSPQSAWVNRGLGGNLEGSGFSGAAGFFRVPGTFSFTNGLASFYGLLTPYVIYFWLEKSRTRINYWLLISSTIALLAAIPLSISRTILFSVILSIAFAWGIIASRPKIFHKFLLGGFAAIGCIYVLSNFPFFQTATLAFTERFTSANTVEGGLEGVLINRFLGGMIEPIADANMPFWGVGLGMGTNVGSQLLSGGKAFLVSEGEWGRIIGEMGLLLGFPVIAIRCLLVLRLLLKSWQNLKSGNTLPWMLLSFSSLAVLQGQWAQPTALGFAVFSGGLVIAAMKDKPVSLSLKSLISR